ncbi:MAG: type II toxin-antitoxin system YafQ family toxin [Isosphaerales bacterium]
METTREFDRDVKRQAKKRGDRIGKLHAVIDLLRNRTPLPRSHRDHALKGEWKGFQECHVGGEGDWLLVYIRTPGKLTLFRTGEHEEIFK